LAGAICRRGRAAYSVVLDVPEDAEVIAFGIMLSGTGTAWLNQAQIEVVPTTVAVTGTGTVQPRAPANLDFTK
jgi:hypothetical protein